jgi:hypothetical protein
MLIEESMPEEFRTPRFGTFPKDRAPFGRVLLKKEKMRREARTTPFITFDGIP